MATSFEGQPAAQGLVLACCLVSIVSLAALVDRRAPRSLASFLNLQWMRCIILMHVATSLLCVVVLTLYLYGVGTSHNCRGSFWVFVVFFLCTKVWLHVFLTERVHLVYQIDKPRHLSWPYWAFACIMAISSAVLVLCFVYQHHYEPLGSDRCYVGYSRAVNWTVIALLLLSEGGATILFLVPIYKSRFSDARKLALRSSISSIASMLSSLGHYLYLPIAGGAVQAWIYALISIADVTFNAYIMFILTQPGSNSSAAPTVISPPALSSSGERMSSDGAIPLHLALTPGVLDMAALDKAAPYGSKRDNSMLRSEEEHLAELRREDAGRAPRWESERAV